MQQVVHRENLRIWVVLIDFLKTYFADFMLKNKCMGKTVTVPQCHSVLRHAWLVAVRGQ